MKKTFVFLLSVFIVNSAYAEFMCEDATVYIALYNINSYTCDAGEFLPANTFGCQPCPTGMSCGGGTFDFNPNNFQGLIFNAITTTTTLNNICADNMVNNLDALYAPNQHTCTAGYYMPANYDVCVICPENSYCVGGTYTFNETMSQGIVSCPTGLYAPMGMASSNQCGRILNIGNEIVYLHSVKKTSPALHIDINNDGVTDFFGNMTTLDVPMTNGTQHKLKISYDGQIYSVYDDSVDLSQYQN